jgi:hypothetical protein
MKSISSEINDVKFSYFAKVVKVATLKETLASTSGYGTLVIFLLRVNFPTTGL